MTKKIRDLLISKKILTETDLVEAEKEALDKKIDPLDILCEKKMLTDEQLGALLSEEYGVPFADLQVETIEEGVFNLIPQIVY